MIKYILIFIGLLAISLSEQDMYTSMEKKSKYGDDVCHYRDKDGFHYVRACEKGKSCQISLSSTSFLGICYDYPQIKTLSNLKEKDCTTTFECESGLTCEGTSCRKCFSTGLDYGEYPSYSCAVNTENQGSGYCMLKTYDTSNIPTTKHGAPEQYKKCGKLTIAQVPGAGNAGRYEIVKDEYDYIGTVKDGEYVSKMELCESGFALYFYYGGKFDDTVGGNQMYLRCVTPLEIHQVNTDSSTCSINYKIGEGDILNYNVEQLNGRPEYTKMDDLCSQSYIKVRSEKFREYSKSISEEERKTCGDLDKLNKYTCENNGLIKSWFSYKNPKIYLLYNERKGLEKVFDFLIEQDYPSYSTSKYISIGFISLLLLFI